MVELSDGWARAAEEGDKPGYLSPQPCPECSEASSLHRPESAMSERYKCQGCGHEWVTGLVLASRGPQRADPLKDSGHAPDADGVYHVQGEKFPPEGRQIG